MTIYNLGSINVDHIYKLSHFPSGGETVASSGYDVGLGGKGVNQSVAAVNAGGEVIHIGSIGAESKWILSKLQEFELKTNDIVISDKITGHAVIYLDGTAENTIVIHAGANKEFQFPNILKSLGQSQPGDWLLLQNETNLALETVNYARNCGLRVAYSAAPFDYRKVESLLPYCDLLVLNEIEAKQCESHITNFASLTECMIFIITRGKAGVTCFINGEELIFPSFPVSAVDTTGAGDTFLGFLLALIDNNVDLKFAIKFSIAAAAMQITRYGAVQAIPMRKEVEAFVSAGK